YTEWSATKARTIFDQMLAQNQNKINGVLAANDGLAGAVVASLKAHGLGKLPLTGQDATPTGVQYILAGWQSGTVYKSVRREANAAAAVAVALLKHKPVPGVNGAGKSTLIKCVAGIDSIDDGQICFDGNPVTIHGPKDAAKLGIEVVYQDLALCDNLDVVQNMFLGRENHDPAFRLREAPMEQRTAETLKSLSVTTIRSVRQPVATVSGGQCQSVAVARAVLWNNRVVFLDEPTAALGVAQTRQVFDLVKRLGEQGLSVVIVSHNLNDGFAVANRIPLLRPGRNV